MISVHYYAPEERKIWSHIGIAFAAVYTTMVSIVYIVELTVIIPQILQGASGQVAQFNVIDNPGFAQSVDGLGYGMQSLSTLFAAQVFIGGGRLEKHDSQAHVSQRTNRVGKHPGNILSSVSGNRSAVDGHSSSSGHFTSHCDQENY